MELTVVSVPHCPNVPLLEERLAQVLTELESREQISIARRTAADADQAARWQLHGSPTLLIEGADPFADPAAPIGLACRMYRDEHGRTEGAPSIGALREVLGQALERGKGAAR
jgi:hypothetical protein